MKLRQAKKILKQMSGPKLGIAAKRLERHIANRPDVPLNVSERRLDLLERVMEAHERAQCARLGIDPNEWERTALSWSGIQATKHERYRILGIRYAARRFATTAADMQR